MTKEYLDEYEKNKKNYTYEINKLEKEIYLEERNKTIDSVVGSSTSYPYIQGHKVIEGINNRRIEKLEKRKSIYEKKLKKLDKELKYKLDNLEDRTVADIIEKKYLKKLEWKQISMDIGYADESGSRKTFDRYFEKK